MEQVRVYNLTVARLHNYAVGDDGVLVHNGACRPGRIFVIGRTGKLLQLINDGIIKRSDTLLDMLPPLGNLADQLRQNAKVITDLAKNRHNSFINVSHGSRSLFLDLESRILRILRGGNGPIWR